MKARISGARPQVLVCLDHNPKNAWLLRAAHKWSKDIQADLIAVHVEAADEIASLQHHHGAVLRSFFLAEKMGAKTLKIDHSSKLEGIVNYVKQLSERKNVSQIYVFVGRQKRKGFFQYMRPTLGELLIQHEINRKCMINFVPLNTDMETPFLKEVFEGMQRKTRLFFGPAVLTLFSFLPFEILRLKCPFFCQQGVTQYGFLYFLIFPAIISYFWGVKRAILMSIFMCSLFPILYEKELGFEFKNAPFFSCINLVLFLIFSTLVSSIVAYIRVLKGLFLKKKSREEFFYRLYHCVGNSEKMMQVAQSLAKEMNTFLNVDTIFFLPKDNDCRKVTSFYQSGEKSISPSQEAVAQKVWVSQSSLGFWDNEGNLECWFCPLSASSRKIGILGFQMRKVVSPDPSFLQLVSSVTNLVAGILERVLLNRQMKESHLREEREKLRSALLSSLSHDLKTPLSGIIGALSLYKNLKLTGQLSPGYEDDLTSTALEEAERLHSFINNILEMTRIESGAISFRDDWYDPIALVNRVIKRMSYTLSNHIVKVVQGNPHMVKLDETMMGQVIQNVLDNAVKYTPKGSQITIFSDMDSKNGEAVLTVHDQGKGVPEDRLDKIFDKFERLKGEDHQTAGTGLGLAICAQIVNHHQGKIYAENRVGGGTKIAIRLPISKSIVRSFAHAA